MEEQPPGDEEYVAPPPPPRHWQGGGQQHGDGGHMGAAQPPPFVFPPIQFWQQLLQQPHQQQAAPQPKPEKVRLPPLHTSRPRTWFTVAESSFNQQHVTNPRMKFDLVVLALNDEQVRRVGAITENPDQYQDPYLALKTRLLEIYQPSKWANVSALLAFKELGGMQPSQLMDELLALLPDGEQPGTLFKGIFLSRLPQDMRDHVQSRADELTCQELARFADHLYDSRNTAKAKMLAALPLPPPADSAPESQVDHLADMVAALGTNKQQNGKSRFRTAGANSKAPQRGQARTDNQRGRQPTGQPAGKPPPGLCYTHFKYGSAAFNCRDPQSCLLAPGN